MAASVPDPTSGLATARVGTVLRDKWKLDALLGVGGMAAVYSATHRNGKRAAVKMLHPQAAADPTVRARFLREGYLANRVGHPGAVSILDDDQTDDGLVYLVMELLEGDTADDVRLESGGKMQPGDVLLVADQALDVLAAAHDKKIVHRDIKPGNLFVTVGGTVKVLDFGIARLAEAAGAPSAATTYSSSMGTVGFMAPEQARGRWELVDGRTDLWSLGATMFMLLSGRMVHEAVTTNEQLLAAMTERAPPLSMHVAGIHTSVAAVVDRALAYDRDERWPDARAMQEAVRKAYVELTGRSLSQAPRPMGHKRTSRAPPQLSAPTLPAFSGPAPRLDATAGANGARGVGGRTRTLAVGVAVACALALTAGVVATRENRAADPHVGSTARALAAPLTGAAVPAPAPTIAPAPSLALPAATAGTTATTTTTTTTTTTATTPATTMTTATTTRAATGVQLPPATAAPARAARPRTPPAASVVAPPPSATVDIFDRRR